MDQAKEEMGIKGFTVQFSQNPKNIEKRGDVLVFDSPLSNGNNLYDTKNGVFTAPRTGVYSFYMSGIVATDDLSGRSDLVIEKTDGKPLQKVFLRSRGDITVYSQGSFHVRCKLNRGEQVHVRHLGGDLGLKGESETTFSGVLEHVYADPFVK
ncbi:cerebellin-1-like [Littorina saxatilis]|uniref:C1q domain-containing protein n=1 Tax=Littorina saxatilis TaxID=31220 RepID=A0AAN9B6P2_9CAEN